MGKRKGEREKERRKERKRKEDFKNVIVDETGRKPFDGVLRQLVQLLGEEQLRLGRHELFKRESNEWGKKQKKFAFFVCSSRWLEGAMMLKNDYSLSYLILFSAGENPVEMRMVWWTLIIPFASRCRWENERRWLRRQRFSTTPQIGGQEHRLVLCSVAMQNRWKRIKKRKEK